HWLRTITSMRRRHYDLVIDTDLRSRTGRWLTRLAQARHKLGFAGRSALTLSIEPAAAPRHAAQSPVFLLREALGSNKRDYPPLSVQLTPHERMQGQARLREVAGAAARKRGGVIGIFANATGPKSMSTAWWARYLRVVEARLPDQAFVEIVPAFGRSMLDDR